MTAIRQAVVTRSGYLPGDLVKMSILAKREPVHAPSIR